MVLINVNVEPEVRKGERNGGASEPDGGGAGVGDETRG